MGLKLAGVALAGSGVQAAMDYFAAHPAPRQMLARRLSGTAPKTDRNRRPE